ncbi:MAG: hypothetical protein QNJ33_12260 [Crocosphaera sp.]|nr:hypothetical protein [Crocosphaera sp.]
MKKQSNNTILQKWLLAVLTNSLKDSLIWIIIVVVIYLFVKPNNVFLSVSSQPQENVPGLVKEVQTFYKTYPKILIFIYDNKNKGKGKLIAIDTEKALIDGEWNALSGNGGEESQLDSGPIPATKNVDLDYYRVRLQPVRFTSVEIEGNFYQINPVSLYINDVKRGDFAIYPNLNVPGTLGDIKIETVAEWDNFQALMLSYQQAGINTIPLLVAYR